VLGDPGARLGGAPRRRATARVVAWGAIAMALTAGIGALVGTVAQIS
jgi:vacuolar iron transporter family protein